MDELIKLTDKVMNLAVKAYMMTDNQKQVLKVRQSQDIFLDGLKRDTDPKTITKLLNEAMFNFYKAKALKT